MMEKPGGGIWRKGLPDLNLTGALLLDVCANHGLTIMNPMLEHKVLHNCTCYQATFSQRSMIDFVVVSFDMHLYALERAVN